MIFIGRSKPVARRISTKECRVVLSDSIVRQYLSRNDKMQSSQSEEVPPQQNQEAVAQVLPDADTSILFVSEETATPKTMRIAKQNAEISQLKLRVRSLKIHVKALQDRLKDLPDESVEIQNRVVVNAVENVVEVDSDVEMQDDDVSNVNAVDLSLNESWTQAQIEEWRENGELSLVCAEFERFITTEQVE